MKSLRVLRPWDFPSKSAGVDCLFLLQGTFLTQEVNPGLPHFGQTLYRGSHQGSPNILLLPKIMFNFFNKLFKETCNLKKERTLFHSEFASKIRKMRNRASFWREWQLGDFEALKNFRDEPEKA